jgi:peroxiredoxin
MKTLLTIFILFTMISSSLEGYKPGDKAKTFNLKNVDGEMISPEDYADAKGFIIIFSCNHCPYVKAYESRMEALNKKYAPKGYPVIAINSNDTAQYPEDSYENMQRNSKQKGFTFPYLIDPTQEIAKAYGALKTPHVFVLQRQGKDLIVKYVGAIDDNTENADKVEKKYVEEAVNALLAGKEIKIKETKAIGCGIKWKE